MDNRPIGVFDSGLGGLAVVKQLKNLLPNEQIVYFGDTGRVPYGNRGLQTLHDYTAQDCNFLLSHDVKLIVAACGTVSSTVPESFINALPVPFVGVIEPTAKAAAQITQTGHIGVIGTNATIKSGSFNRALLEISDELTVSSRACPLFVSLVENGYISEYNQTTLGVARDYLDFVNSSNVDTLILGCTHFPILAPIIKKAVERDITLIDPGVHTSNLVAQILTERDMLSDKRSGDDKFFVSDRGETFREVAHIFMGYDISDSVQTFSVAQLPTTLAGGHHER